LLCGHSVVILLRWLFVALLPAPDLGLLGNLWSRQVGAVAYDLTHTYLPPATLAVVGVVTGSGLAVALALVWFAHIGMDRTLGLGLQYPDGSGRTHLRETPQRRSGGRPEPEAREERTGLAGAGVALRWADRQANPHYPRAGSAAVAAVAW
jgi:hypothetical protein